ncbi:MAG: hypothetical protein VB074_01880 [Proteiniphilum sp.]|jgi:hypothetical protein|uniref:hypothetical protein n=1 Tax=Proteiniphilum sp. TaxID=1926877 RepID=UPI002B1F0E4C|nr:hypothetical protein [Proteiniphilum sp.]MEA5126910.1 hypothetical protein [Proteiniphilum sp.]
MGTSQSVNPSVKNNPNWGDLSRAISVASRSADISDNQLQGIMRHFVNAVGGSGAGHGRSNTFGRAGISRAQRFISFVSDVQRGGFDEASRSIGIIDVANLSVNDYINHLLTYCADGNSNLDETAANGAMDELLKHILNNVDSLESIENIFQEANIETQHEWLCFFFASYIMEFSDELFSTRIFENEGDRVRTFQEIRNYVQRSLEGLNPDEGLQNVDWHGEEGVAVIKNLQTEILEIWSQE